MRPVNIYLPLSPRTQGFYVLSNGDTCFFYGHARDLQYEITTQHNSSPSRRAVLLLIGSERDSALLEEACLIRFEKVSNGHKRVIVGWEAETIISIIKGIVMACGLEFMRVHDMCIEQYYDEITHTPLFTRGRLGVTRRGGNVNECGLQ